MLPADNKGGLEMMERTISNRRLQCTTDMPMRRRVIMQERRQDRSQWRRMRWRDSRVVSWHQGLGRLLQGRSRDTHQARRCRIGRSRRGWPEVSLDCLAGSGSEGMGEGKGIRIGELRIARFRMHTRQHFGIWEFSWLVVCGWIMHSLMDILILYLV